MVDGVGEFALGDIVFAELRERRDRDLRIGSHELECALGSTSSPGQIASHPAEGRAQV